VLLTAAAASLLLTRGVHQQATTPVNQIPDEPPLIISADPGLGITEAALHDALAALAIDLGVPVPPATLRLDPQLPQGALRVRLLGAALLVQSVPPGEAPLPLLRQALAAAAAELLTLDDVQRLLDELQRGHPALLREVVPRRIELPRLTALLRCLLDERVWPLDVRAVLETVAALPKVEPELHPLVEQVRAGLGRFLVHGYVRAAAATSPGAEGLPALLLDSEIEELVRESRRGPHRTTTSDDSPLAIEPELQRDIVQSVLTAKAQSPGAVVLCHSDVRRQVQRLLCGSPQALPVLAYSELPPSLPVLVMGHITPGA
jgi:type III secretory pathway component EscV